MRSILLTLILFPVSLMAQKTPDQLYGPLFTEVQERHLFADSKTFTDALPRYRPQDIAAAFEGERRREDFDLRMFVEANFLLPQKPISDYQTQETDVEQHINRLWHVLHRKADTAAEGSSLLPLPHEYIVPGGRFREIYYWDSYFTMLGLRESGEHRTIANMVKNFAWLIDTYGHIPNGNRTYYLSRSQPPFFSLMVELLAGIEGDRIYADYLPQLQREYRYWMDSTAPTHHVVVMKDGSKLNRYWDQLEIPRQEAWTEDKATVAHMHADSHPRVYRDLRSAAESGWDFSSRWFADGKTIHSIHTTTILPVDLNCLLLHLEQTIVKAARLKGIPATATRYEALAAARRKAIGKYFWSPRHNWFMDYDLRANHIGHVPTLAGMFPFFLGAAEKGQMRLAKKLLQTQFLKPGGVVTTLRNTGQQWDSPNGWAPLQWVTVAGLERYGESALARNIANRWVSINLRVFRQTGKLTEKYDVVHADKVGGGGEYPTQDGFGWTNGVLLALMKKLENGRMGAMGQ